MKLLAGAAPASATLLGLAAWAAWEALTEETIDVFAWMRSGL